MEVPLAHVWDTWTRGTGVQMWDKYKKDKYKKICADRLAHVCWNLEEFLNGRCNGNQHTVLQHTAIYCAAIYYTATHWQHTNPPPYWRNSLTWASTSVPTAHRFLHLPALHIHTHTYTYIHTYMCTYIHMYTCTYVHICIPHKLTHVSQHMSTSSCTCDKHTNLTYEYTYIYTYIFTYVHMRTYTYMYTWQAHMSQHNGSFTSIILHIHTHVHIYINICTHVHIPVRLTYVGQHINASSCAYFTYAHTHTKKYICIHIYLHTYVHMYICKDVHMYIYIHVYIYTTGICICTYIQMSHRNTHRTDSHKWASTSAPLLAHIQYSHTHTHFIYTHTHTHIYIYAHTFT